MLRKHCALYWGSGGSCNIALNIDRRPSSSRNCGIGRPIGRGAPKLGPGGCRGPVAVCLSESRAHAEERGGSEEYHSEKSRGGRTWQRV